MTRAGRRRIAWLGGIMAAMVSVFALMTDRWFIRPETTNPTSADAVVVLAGGTGERLARGLELMAQRVAPTLVLNEGVDWAEPVDVVRAVKDLCHRSSSIGATPPPFEIVCVSAVPDSTKGEAITIAQLAEHRGWKTLALVTTDHHLARSARWFRRCFSGAVLPVAAAAPTFRLDVQHEWFGTIAQFTYDRSCSA
jgi:uncharacterized SAM-binding protein YcdF (DUF218 family)